MKVLEVTASRTRKVNIGNFESKDYFLSVKAELSDFDQKPEAIDQIIFDLFADLDRRLKSVIETDLY